MTSKLVAAIAILLAFAVRPAAATAAGLDEVHDTQCLALAALMMNNSNSGSSQAALLSSLFFMGKLYGRDPNYDIVAAMKPVIETMNEARLKTLAPECGAELALRGKQMEEAGAALQALER